MTLAVMCSMQKLSAILLFFIATQSGIHPFSGKILSQSVLVILPNFSLTVFFDMVNKHNAKRNRENMCKISCSGR